MSESNIFYRAFGELFKNLTDNGATTKLIDAIAKAPQPESVIVIHNVCQVDTDWLDEIERGLVFVGKAIEEDRQFIRADGEVKPIEKVKHISKESVQYLARHSDLITREQKGDIIPDKIYTVEKESDYAVYENKFLYLLLTLVRDFVSVRYEAIANAYKEYHGEYTVTKTVKTSNRRLKFSINIDDEKDDALFAPADEDCADAIDRMDGILQSVSFYLNTPLMQEVSRAYKISGKITKTNVLLKDKNFFGALQLYEWLLAYDKQGYTIERRRDKPEITKETMRELAIPALLSAFLVYEHGLGLEKHLQAEFEKEELRREEEAQKELLRKIKALKKRIEKTGESVEQYILLLEERNVFLEKSHKQLQEALKKIEELQGCIQRLQIEINMLRQDVEKLNEEKRQLVEQMARAEEEHKRQIDEMQLQFQQEITSLKNAHAEELSQTKQRANEQLELLKKQNAEQIERICEKHKEETEKLRAAQNDKLEAAQSAYKRETEKMRAQYETLLKDGADKMKETENKAQNAFDEFARIQNQLKYTTEERDVLSARLTAVRKENGLLSEADDFTTEAGFNALEHEFEVLGKLLVDEWKNVKTALRKNFYGDIRSSMRKKNAKTKEYAQLQQFVQSQKSDAQPSETVASDGNNTESKN